MRPNLQPNIYKSPVVAQQLLSHVCNYKVQFCAFKGDAQNLPLRRVSRGRSPPQQFPEVNRYVHVIRGVASLEGVKGEIQQYFTISVYGTVSNKRGSLWWKWPIKRETTVLYMYYITRGTSEHVSHFKQNNLFIRASTKHISIK